ncbi:MAG: hypothetical protein MUF30_07800 [Burkholderiales bacterium]|nr:hypothetical protein [Burkholderiales bacterium]
MAAPGVHTVTVEAGETVSDVDFGSFRLGTVRGAVFADIDGDGTRDAGEVGAAGRTVWLDADSDGERNAGELEATTAADGTFEIAGVRPGSFTLRALEPIGFTSTTPDGVALSMTSGREIVDTALGTTAEALQIASFTNDASGFAVHFNHALGTDESLDVFTSRLASGAIRAADVQVRDVATGRMLGGSVIVDADARGLRFVRSGGLVPAGEWQVTLAGRADGIVDAAGRVLDGDGDGVAGGDATLTWRVDAVAPGTPVLLLGDAVRGPGQSIAVPNGPAQAAGRAFAWPIRVDASVAGARRVELKIVFDASQLDLEGLVLAAGLDGAVLTVGPVEPVPGEPAGGQTRQTSIVVVMSTGLDVPAAGRALLEIQARVRTDATIGRASTVQLRDIVVTDADGSARAGIGDSAVHVSGYVGDADADGRYTAADTALIQRFVARQIAGFDPWRSIDAVLVADVNDSGTATAQDAFVMQRVAAGLLRLEIPVIPAAPVSMTAEVMAAAMPLPTRATAPLATPAPAAPAAPAARETASNGAPAPWLSAVPMLLTSANRIAPEAPTPPRYDVAPASTTSISNPTAWSADAWARDLSQRLAGIDTKPPVDGRVGVGGASSSGVLAQLARGVLRK